MPLLIAQEIATAYHDFVTLDTRIAPALFDSYGIHDIKILAPDTPGGFLPPGRPRFDLMVKDPGRDGAGVELVEVP